MFPIGFRIKGFGKGLRLGRWPNPLLRFSPPKKDPRPTPVEHRPYERMQEQAHGHYKNIFHCLINIKMGEKVCSLPMKGFYSSQNSKMPGMTFSAISSMVGMPVTLAAYGVRDMISSRSNTDRLNFLEPAIIWRRPMARRSK